MEIIYIVYITHDFALKYVTIPWQWKVGISVMKYSDILSGHWVTQTTFIPVHL